MSEVRLPRWVVPFVFAFVIAGCKHHDDPGINTGVCRDGVGDKNRQAPIICVNDSAERLTVDPEPAEANESRLGAPSTPVMIHWWTVSGTGALGIEMHGDACPRTVDCAPGHCWAKTKPGSVGTCKYDVWTTPTNRLDPTIIINPCCP